MVAEVVDMIMANVEMVEVVKGGIQSFICINGPMVQVAIGVGSVTHQKMDISGMPLLKINWADLLPIATKPDDFQGAILV